MTCTTFALRQIEVEIYGKNHETSGNGWESFLSKELIINAKNPHINVHFINIKQVEQYVYHMKP
jgi:hypothetical protein